MGHPVARGDLSEQVFAEQVAIVYRLLPFTLAQAALGGTIVLLVLWLSVPHTWLVGWYLVHLLVILYGYLLIRAYRRAALPTGATRSRARRFMSGYMAAGSVWGFSGSIMFPPPGNPAHSLKSSSMSIGAVDLSALCRELELGCKSGVIDGAAARVAAIEKEYALAEKLLLAEIGGVAT